MSFRLVRVDAEGTPVEGGGLLGGVKGLLHERAKVNTIYALVALVLGPQAFMVVVAVWHRDWETAKAGADSLGRVGLPLLVGLLGINAALGRRRQNGEGV